MSRTRLALKLHKANPKLTHQAIADKVGISRPAVSMAIREEKRTAPYRCRHCGGFIQYLKGVIKD